MPLPTPLTLAVKSSILENHFRLHTGGQAGFQILRETRRLANFILRLAVIGNHDIEIAFPPVQRLLRLGLADDNLMAQARIEFSTAGAGYSCLVGGARIYCIHGTEVDG